MDMMQTNQTGNNSIRGMLSQYVAKIVDTGNIPVPFLLLAGAKWLWKMSIAKDAMKTLLGEYIHQDGLVLEDYSHVLEKHHTIKISSDEEITLSDGSIYKDVWIREMLEWMVKSPLWTYKVLVIEDIERMTEGAANALLKILEEPLAWRMIFVTTSHIEQILPTILSRALVFSFHPESEHAVNTYIATQPLLAQYDNEFLHAIAHGRPWVLMNLLEKGDEALQNLYNAFVALCQKTKNVSSLYKTLVPVAKTWSERELLQAYISYAVKHQLRSHVVVAKNIYMLLDYPINVEHILFDFANQIYSSKK